MQHCWAADPTVRPTFGELAGEVALVVATLRGDHYVQLPVAYVNVGPGAPDKAITPSEQSPSPTVHRSPGRPRPLSEPPRPT